MNLYKSGQANKADFNQKEGNMSVSLTNQKSISQLKDEKLKGVYTLGKKVFDSDNVNFNNNNKAENKEKSKVFLNEKPIQKTDKKSPTNNKAIDNTEFPIINPQNVNVSRNHKESQNENKIIIENDSYAKLKNKKEIINTNLNMNSLNNSFQKNIILNPNSGKNNDHQKNSDFYNYNNLTNNINSLNPNNHLNMSENYKKITEMDIEKKNSLNISTINSNHMIYNNGHLDSTTKTPLNTIAKKDSMFGLENKINKEDLKNSNNNDSTTPYSNIKAEGENKISNHKSYNFNQNNNFDQDNLTYNKGKNVQVKNNIPKIKNLQKKFSPEGFISNSSNNNSKSNILLFNKNHSYNYSNFHTIKNINSSISNSNLHEYNSSNNNSKEKEKLQVNNLSMNRNSLEKLKDTLTIESSLRKLNNRNESRNNPTFNFNMTLLLNKTNNNPTTTSNNVNFPVTNIQNGNVNSSNSNSQQRFMDNQLIKYIKKEEKQYVTTLSKQYNNNSISLNINKNPEKASKKRNTNLRISTSPNYTNIKTDNNINIFNNTGGLNLINQINSISNLNYIKNAYSTNSISGIHNTSINHQILNPRQNLFSATNKNGNKKSLNLNSNKNSLSVSNNNLFAENNFIISRLNTEANANDKTGCYLMSNNDILRTDSKGKIKIDSLDSSMQESIISEVKEYSSSYNILNISKKELSLNPKMNSEKAKNNNFNQKKSEHAAKTSEDISKTKPISVANYSFLDNKTIVNLDLANIVNTLNPNTIQTDVKNNSINKNISTSIKNYKDKSKVLIKKIKNLKINSSSQHEENLKAKLGNNQSNSISNINNFNNNISINHLNKNNAVKSKENPNMINSNSIKNSIFSGYSNTPTNFKNFNKFNSTKNHSNSGSHNKNLFSSFKNTTNENLETYLFNKNKILNNTNNNPNASNSASHINYKNNLNSTNLNSNIKIEINPTDPNVNLNNNKNNSFSLHNMSVSKANINLADEDNRTLNHFENDKDKNKKQDKTPDALNNKIRLIQDPKHLSPSPSRFRQDTAMKKNINPKDNLNVSNSTSNIFINNYNFTHSKNEMNEPLIFEEGKETLNNISNNEKNETNNNELYSIIKKTVNSFMEYSDDNNQSKSNKSNIRNSTSLNNKEYKAAEKASLNLSLNNTLGNENLVESLKQSKKQIENKINFNNNDNDNNSSSHPSNLNLENLDIEHKLKIFSNLAEDLSQTSRENKNCILITIENLFKKLSGGNMHNKFDIPQIINKNNSLNNYNCNNNENYDNSISTNLNMNKPENNNNYLNNISNNINPSHFNRSSINNYNINPISNDISCSFIKKADDLGSSNKEDELLKKLKIESMQKEIFDLKSQMKVYMENKFDENYLENIADRIINKIMADLNLKNQKMKSNNNSGTSNNPDNSGINQNNTAGLSQSSTKNNNSKGISNHKDLRSGEKFKVNEKLIQRINKNFEEKDLYPLDYTISHIAKNDQLKDLNNHKFLTEENKNNLSIIKKQNSKGNFKNIHNTSNGKGNILSTNPNCNIKSENSKLTKLNILPPEIKIISNKAFNKSKSNSAGRHRKQEAAIINNSNSFDRKNKKIETSVNNHNNSSVNPGNLNSNAEGNEIGENKIILNDQILKNLKEKFKADSKRLNFMDDLLIKTKHNKDYVKSNPQTNKKRYINNNLKTISEFPGHKKSYSDYEVKHDVLNYKKNLSIILNAQKAMNASSLQIKSNERPSITRLTKSTTLNKLGKLREMLKINKINDGSINANNKIYPNNTYKPENKFSNHNNKMLIKNLEADILKNKFQNKNLLAYKDNKYLISNNLEFSSIINRSNVSLFYQ